ncbi:MAG: zinc-binding dehydrogenase [Candidatus Eisenbacteria bacterium]|nr:zinc-binding dehydrogenase [Candidatus Eisenbacteria bacterium]
MKAWRIPEHGGPDALQLETGLPDPEPGPGQVRVRVRAAALNHLDLWVRRGVPGHPFPLPMIPGSDVAGEVDRTGPGVAGWNRGDPVLIAPGFGCGACPRCLAGDDNLCRSYGILGETRDGACAEFVVVPATHVTRMPANLQPTAAAALPLVSLTAWHMLVAKAGVRPGDWVLVHAGASGVGSMAIQIAKLHGAQVITTIATPGKADRVRPLGADHLLVSTEVDVAKEVRRLTSKRGVDIVVDHLGGEPFQKALACLARGGRLVNCGATVDAKVGCDLRIVFFKNLAILGSTMGRRGEVETTIELARQGRLQPVVDRVFPMNELPQAHAYLEERRAVGKVVVEGFGV